MTPINKETRKQIYFFKKFLLEHGVYREYLENVSQCGDDFLKDIAGKYIYRRWIGSVFVWENTPQGHEFWEKINDKWRAFGMAKFK